MAQFNLCFRVAFLAVLLPLTSGACVDFCLGMGSGTIPDSNINASSVQSASTPAKNGRLNYTSGSSWCAGTSDTNPYLQIDLQTLHIICAVSTQGNSQADQWVKTYTLQLSTDGTTWTDYKEGGQVKVLEGNKDINSNVKHVLYGVLTRYLRFLPQTHQGEVCMRTEVFGVQQKPTCDSQAIGLASGGRIPDDSFSASSIFAAIYAAKYGRLNGRGAWEPKTNSRDEYLQIDLLYEYVICAVATQGNPPSNSAAQEWTTEYKLRFSFNGTTFFPYKENKTDRAFPGNSGKTDTVKNSLKEFASAKFIRFLPTRYNRFKVLRVEAYGILFTKVPSQPPTAFKLTATSSTSIAASWQLPPVYARHGTIKGFKLFYTEKGSGVSVTNLTISGESTFSRNVTGLNEYTEYAFQVLAFTSDGDGPKSSVEVERTMEDVPSQAPKSLTVTARTSTIVTASWQLPPLDSRNGIITGFKLFYKKKTVSGSLAMLRIDNGAIHNKTVIGLDKNTEYEFQVLAFTSAGDGPKSSPVVVRTMKDGCVDFYLGMGSGTIPDSNINASSVESASTPAKNGRLNYTSGSSWCAGTSDTNPYLQIDLQMLHIICAVSTQGNSQADQWVKTYTLQLSTNGITWTNYKELGGQVKVFEGNKDRNSNVKHVVYGVLTRYLRFLPQTHHGEVCMRTEVFGVQQNPTCDSQAIGLASSGRIPDDSFSASSIFKDIYAAKYGRLNGRGAWEPKTTTDADDYLQIDLLYEYVICAVATQGNPPSQSPTAQEWTTEYKLRFSLNGTTFLPYKENKIDKAFPGNTGKTDTVKNSLKEFASAKFIRFLPTKYNTFKVLRVEAYGILFTKVPSQPPTAFKLTASSSTSIAASWQLPPVFSRHGRNIIGFKLFYKKKGCGGPATALSISSGSILSRNVTGLDKFAEYEFQVLAFTSDGDGPKSPVEVERTKEAAPSQAPRNFSAIAVTSTIITASWQLPPADSRNGIIIGFKLFYKKRGPAGLATTLTINNGTALSKNVSGLDIYTEYEFEVLASTSVGDGPRSSPMVVVITLKDGCVKFSLGMEDGRILDTRINASSSSTPAKNGRLNYASGSSWCARTSDTNPYLQIDLKTLHIICAVSTQGNSNANQWVETYTLQLSLDGTTWTDYKESGGQVKVLMGNDDKNSEVKHVVYGVLTRYLRFRPQTHQGGVCMRTEVFGVKKKPTCDSQAIGLASGGRIPDDSFSASSIFKARYAAKYGRLNGRGAWEPKTTTDPDDYLQINLLYEYVICAVATQGNPPSQSRAQEWTTEYKIRFSLNGTTFFPYEENKIDKAFPGNSGKTDTVKNSLKEFASAKFIRFLPTKYNKFKVLRVEAYGILLTKVPSQPPTAFQLTASSSTSITASWQLPPVFARHGNITGFKLFYKRKGSGGSATTLSISDEATLSRTVSGLDIFTEYQFQVLAFTSDGDGPKSFAEVNRTMEDAPSQPPSNFNVTPTSSTSVTASWQLPPANSRNGIIKGFKLFYKRKDSSDSGTILSINSESTLNKNVNGLYKYTEYEFQVLAFTSAGDGVNSSVVKRTKEDVPSQPPSGFTLAATTSTSITASWQLPPEDSINGIIRGYKLFYKKKGSSGAGSIKSIKSQAIHTKEVTGLDKYTEYEFQILAFTSVGDGPNSTVIFKKTKEAAPSQPPSQFSVTVESSTSITASWRLPPEGSRHGIIKGYRLFYKKKYSDSGTSLTLNYKKTSKRVTSLDEYTKYEFQVLAFTSAGDGPNSSTVFKTTMEDAPSAPLSLSSVNVPPSNSHGTRINLTWSEPAEPNGVIRSYTLFYSHNGGAAREISGIDKDALSHTVDVFGGVTYQFSVRAVTIKPGKNVTKTVTTKEYAPGVGPEPPSSAQVNKTTFNISWEPLLREKSYGKVILYEVKTVFLKKGNVRKRSVLYSPSVNTSVTFVVLSDLELCSKYNVSVRAYTAEGPGPYGEPLELETSRPEAPGEFKVTDFGTNQITLAWKQYDEKEKIVYTVKYTGTKSYNKTFRDEKTTEAIKVTTQKVEGLIPGTTYEFSVHGNSVCGESASKVVSKMTDMIAPEGPVPYNITDVEVSQTAVDIYLWPVEQKYGPISAYQVIVLKVADGVKELPDNYDSKLKAVSDAKKENVNFYIAAEIENVPLLSKPQKFTVGDGSKTKEFMNEELEKGANYTVYERAVTKAEKEELKGNANIIAKISITSTTTGAKKERSSGSNAAAVAVPVVLLLLLIPAVVVAVFLYRRRRQSRSKSAGERSVQLDDIKDDSQDPTSSTSNLVYQNVGDIRRTIHGAEKQSVSEENEAIYSEADDGKPKPIPVAEFPKYFKRKSENGAIVLREEFKYLPGGMQFAWEIGKSNRGKNRYGNIVSYDHSRVLLEEIEGDKNSSYINASYIPTYDEVTMTYIATQGPTSTTIADFWRMVWQENSFTIVMLTNLVELGKGKCDQYWPDDTSKFGAITVTLHKTETFADYAIRSLIVTKDAEKRTVLQFHYVTWPDKGVPQHSTALLGFRQKIHARHQATGGPLVVHCSAGVGRTGTYIAIDAMLESAEKIKTVFIQNYVQVMRRSRPHMIQKDDQYVFLHQAVMEALVCGNTEIIPQNLRIATNKLAKVHKPSKKTGYEGELKRLELVTDAHASQEVARNAFMPANVVKNRFPNIVPLDNARVHLQASSQEKSYINASYVDDYTQRNAYILTQAPLDCTIIDFWLMISQYDIGTVVMLNNLEEGKQSYPQYWPSEGSAKYGEVTVQLLSQETSNNITTRGFSVENAARPKKTSTLQHIQYNGWANENSCPDPQDILDLMTTVQQSQQQSGNRVIVFQCSDGTGRSGCVATIMSVIERVKTEQTVDVFQTVKLVRAKRPGAVNTLELYMFCYKTVLAYLDSFSTYSNFAEC